MLADQVRMSLVLAMLALVAGRVTGDEPGKDMRLTYLSQIDGTEQPYRLYVPSVYDGKQPLPLVIALHGTGGTEATLFDTYKDSSIKQAAEKHKTLLVSPLGHGTTEYRGIGENDVLCVLDAVRQRYHVDDTRVYLTGHSMGGTGSAYLTLHHPDLFAAAAPLAAAYSFPWLARNAQRTPFLWIGGAADAEFYHRGVACGVERMRKFGVPVTSEALPGEGHNGPVKDFDRVFAWLLKHQRDPNPKAYFFEVDTPLHGRAYWTTVERIAEPGMMASVTAEAAGNNVARFLVTNVAAFSFEPDAAVFDLTQPITVYVNGREVSRAVLAADQALRLNGEHGRWQAQSRKKESPALTAYRTHPVAKAAEALDMLGTEKRLANWITDAMRQATGADIALYNGYAYRGLPLPKGTVDVVDLIQCSRPFDQNLVTVKLTGQDLLDILDDNIPDQRDVRSKIDQPGASQLVQVSGARYVFDPRRPAGKRIVESDLKPERTYTVVLEGQVVERQTIRLAGRFKKLDYLTTDVPFTLALYGHAARSGKIEGHAKGRVRELSP